MGGGKRTNKNECLLFTCLSEHSWDKFVVYFFFPWKRRVKLGQSVALFGKLQFKFYQISIDLWVTLSNRQVSNLDCFRYGEKSVFHF